MLKKWEKAEERARKALEKQRVKEELKKKRVGRNWMKKIVPNPKLTNITENPYLPLGVAKHGGVVASNEAVARKKSKKEAAALIIPDFPMDKNDVMTCNREMLHAVLANDVKRVKAIIADTKHTSTIFQTYSVGMEDVNPFWLAVDLRRLEIYEIFLKEIQRENLGKGKRRVNLPVSTLETQSTGNVNPYAYNAYIRKVAVARGAKEGNNAFTHDKSIKDVIFELNFADLLKHNPTKQMVEMYANILHGGMLNNNDYTVVVEAVR